jgi:hypothetical protein
MAVSGILAAGAELDTSCVPADTYLRSGCPDPGAFLTRLLERINRHRDQPLSQVLAGLDFPQGTVAGAAFSDSLQGSDTLDNPRVYLMTACGPLTFSLYGDSFELALINQTPHDPIGHVGSGAFHVARGEMLAEIRVPSARALTASDVLDHLNPDFVRHARPEDYRQRRIDVPRLSADGKPVLDSHQNPIVDAINYDSHACSDCHVDTSSGATGDALGQTTIQVGDHPIEAILLPFARVPEETADGPLYCVGTDLPALYACRCEGDRTACAPFEDLSHDGKRELAVHSEAADQEACRRLGTALRLRLRQHCDYDPRAATQPAPCLTAAPPASLLTVLRLRHAAKHPAAAHSASSQR